MSKAVVTPEIEALIQERITQALTWAADECRREERWNLMCASRTNRGSRLWDVHHYAATRVNEVERVIRMAAEVGSS